MESLKEADIVITLIAGTLVIFLMVTVIIWTIIKYQKRVLDQQKALQENDRIFQKSLLEASIKASENERMEVAKNIHDDVGTVLNVMKLNNARIKKNINDNVMVERILDANNQLLHDIVENVRSISTNLSSPVLHRLGLFKALDIICRQVNITNEIKVDFNYDDGEKRLSKDVELNLYRTCNEVINNIIKHGNTKNISISAVENNGGLTLLFLYTGNGITDLDAEQLMKISKGLGLKSIVSRLQILKGTINYYINENAECKVIIKLPL
jgi:signal transduction histidine kinase